ncbi:uncharacterized protein L969DRAFT_81986 [Mixia osmundae IAM 14324]|nr:uncharacterized protein L969DRAFT_81986 [Mixia osmundae IAM 14324]KEI40237.1 hypothetical protein L969DRAFT_81986 [Mixia osmundae IAM 14324]
MLTSKLELDNFDAILDALDLHKVLDREVAQLSGGELQRFIIALTCVQRADVYMFDEPTSYLDIKQRLKASRMIRSLLNPTCYVIVVEHDLAILDYLSDFICCLYGKPGAYGVVTLPQGVREGINIFLDGEIPTENLRFRDEKLTFKITETADDIVIEKTRAYSYPKMTKTLGDFKLSIEPGEFTDSEIIVMLGENGTGKTTFVKLLGNNLEADDGVQVPNLNQSTKPQTLSPKNAGTVRHLFLKKIRAASMTQQFISEVMKPMNVDPLMDQELQTLSGGELQRVAIVLCLGQLKADIFLLDEPSAHLDAEQRIIASRVIKRWILASQKTAFVVEHDFMMSTYLADRVIVFDGQPAIKARANT